MVEVSGVSLEDIEAVLEVTGAMLEDSGTLLEISGKALEQATGTTCKAPPKNSDIHTNKKNA